MTTTSGSVLCCSRDYLSTHYRIILLSHYHFIEDLDRSDRWDSIYSTFNRYFHGVFFRSGCFEAGRHAEALFSFKPVINITFYHIAAHQHAHLNFA